MVGNCWWSPRIRTRAEPAERALVHLGDTLGDTTSVPPGKTVRKVF